MKLKGNSIASFNQGHHNVLETLLRVLFNRADLFIANNKAYIPCDHSECVT